MNNYHFGKQSSFYFQKLDFYMLFIFLLIRKIPLGMITQPAVKCNILPVHG